MAATFRHLNLDDLINKVDPYHRHDPTHDNVHYLMGRPCRRFLPESTPKFDASSIVIEALVADVPVVIDTSAPLPPVAEVNPIVLEPPGTPLEPELPVAVEPPVVEPEEPEEPVVVEPEEVDPPPVVVEPPEPELELDPEPVGVPAKLDRSPFGLPLDEAPAPGESALLQKAHVPQTRPLVAINPNTVDTPAIPVTPPGPNVWSDDGMPWDDNGPAWCDAGADQIISLHPGPNPWDDNGEPWDDNADGWCDEIS